MCRSPCRPWRCRDRRGLSESGGDEMYRSNTSQETFDRRALLQVTAAGLVSLAVGRSTCLRAEQPKSPDKGKPTRFQIACMTLPYAQFPLERALTGIKAAGYQYVAWGTTHAEAGGKRVPVVAGDAPPERAKELGKKCRDLGLEPVLLFGPSPESGEAFKHR